MFEQLSYFLVEAAAALRYKLLALLNIFIEHL